MPIAVIVMGLFGALVVVWPAPKLDDPQPPATAERSSIVKTFTAEATTGSSSYTVVVPGIESKRP